MQKLETDVIKGYVTLLLFDEEGSLKDARQVRNLVVNVGRTGSGERISNPGTGVLAANWIAVGTGTNAPASTDTALGGEIGRKSAAYTNLGVGSWKIVQSWGTGEAVAAITESGVFFGSYVSMFCRATFAVINKASGDTLEITWGFTIS
jgi:hypothetical protein